MVKEERESRRRRGREERAQVKAAPEEASWKRLLCSEVPLAAPEAAASFAAAAVDTEVTGLLLLFIHAAGRNLSEHGFRRDFFVNICLPVAFKYRIFCCTAALMK